MITNLNWSSSYIQGWKKKDGDNRLLLAAPPIQLHVTYVVGSSRGRHRYKRETPPYGTHWVGCVIPLLCCAILWHRTRLNGSRGVGAVFLNLRMLSKRGISRRSHINKWSWRYIDEYQAPRETKRSCRHTICAYKDRQELSFRKQDVKSNVWPIATNKQVLPEIGFRLSIASDCL